MKFVAFLIFSALCTQSFAKPRARDLGIPFEGTPGKRNAISDVDGVEVGHSTIIAGEGKGSVGRGPVRTGVTAILPAGKKASVVPAAIFSLNGNGELTGSHWIEESGFIDGPLLFTNTYSVGVVHAAVRAWADKRFPAKVAGEESAGLPVVGETYDGMLNDALGYHVKEAHVFEALDKARGDNVAEGNVGGGTGMVCFEFKGGIGTSSRRVRAAETDYVVGVMVQANFGARKELLVAGVPVGKLLPQLMPETFSAKRRDGSILVAIATNAPLLPSQLKRLAKRASLGLGRVGSIAHDSSGDLFIAFSTQVPKKDAKGIEQWKALPNAELNALFEGVVHATEESIINAMVAAETMTGFGGTKVHAIPHAELRTLLTKHGRI